MQLPRSSRGRYEARTLEKLKHDLERFMSAGGKLQNAKLFNNVIDRMLFNVPLDQVFFTVIPFITAVNATVHNIHIPY